MKGKGKKQKKIMVTKMDKKKKKVRLTEKKIKILNGKA